MSELPDWANWLARVKDGGLFAYERKPKKGSVVIISLWLHGGRCEYISEVDDTYAHIKWEDEEPTPVKTISGENLLNESTTGFHRLENAAEQPSIVSEEQRLENLYDQEMAIKPEHYRTNQGKYTDLFDKWYHENELHVFRAIMRATAERYITRYENKNGVIDLEKGIYTLERLKEYEEERQ